MKDFVRRAFAIVSITALLLVLLIPIVPGVNALVRSAWLVTVAGRDPMPTMAMGVDAVRVFGGSVRLAGVGDASRDEVTIMLDLGAAPTTRQVAQILDVAHRRYPRAGVIQLEETHPVAAGREQDVLYSWTSVDRTVMESIYGRRGGRTR